MELVRERTHFPRQAAQCVAAQCQVSTCPRARAACTVLVCLGAEGGAARRGRFTSSVLDGSQARPQEEAVLPDTGKD